MDALIYLDTHVVVWLYLPKLDSLSELARTEIEHRDLLISPMVTLELQYLHEIGRLTVDSSQILHSLSAQLGVRTCDLPFPQVIERAVAQHWTRDPFDRLIAAHALAADRPLLTADETIRANCPQAIW